ncbi:hypothetical protein KI387_002234 [Taxus chinensis]|uniref:Reverse transcriptase domain-containing protein n=1 Tax=Taxus chinensis TaxID=29808 RepID=A0AA38LNF8_TAXCH|nr:hypothetical protein KI387_002234 [Taxus chinensis]
MVEDRLLELLGGLGLEARFKEEVEETEELQLENACLEKEKGKLVYVFDGEQEEILDVSHSVGTREVVDNADTHAHTYHEHLKTKKVNIGSGEEPKETIIGDYWSENEVFKIIDLLQEFEDLFSHGYHELKGVHHSLGEMKIKLKDNAHPVRKRPYQINPNLHVKVMEEIDKMIASRIIEAMEESDWINLMVINIKKDGWIRISVDYRELNAVCVINPFPTPFIEEILEGVARHEIYSFTDGFSGYHQVRITKEDQEKTTFTTEWGIFAYTVMPFGLKNVLVFSCIVVQVFQDFIHKFLQVYLDD